MFLTYYVESLGLPSTPVVFMKRRLPPISFLLYAALAIFVGVIVAYSAGIRFTLTPSMPIGLYRLVDEPLAKGAMVTFCPPAWAADFALERGYLHRGPCNGGTEPLGKYILAVPGDTLVARPEGLTLNGKVIPASAIHFRDRLGRELMHLPFGQHVIGPDSLFLFSGHHPRSFDSRYFGAVPRSSIISSLYPLWTTE